MIVPGCARAPSSDDTVAGDSAPIDAPPANPTTPLPDPTGANAYVYTCPDDFRFSVRLRDDSAHVRLPARTVTLPHVESASGARYEAEGVLFWSKGSEASLETSSGARTGCQGRPAATPWEEAAFLGIEFRAVGNEPGWVLEIDEQQWMRYVGDYGAIRVLAPVPEPVLSDDGTRTLTARTEAHTLEAVIREAPCSDTMSGEAFTHTVSVRLGGREVQGCGREVATPDAPAY